MTKQKRAGMALTGMFSLLGLAHAVAAQELRLLDGRKQSLELVDALVAEAMNTADVPGLGVAIIHDGRVAFARTYGQRNLELGLPLQKDTVMYGASLTKATFAYLVMQLVDEKKITLDAPIGTYLARPLPEYGRYADLKDDARWNKLTFRILLNHTTGFANFRWIEPDKKLRFHFDPGTRYAYSGEGLQLAQFVLEEGLKLDVGREMQTRVFDRFGMMRTSMTWRDDFERNFAQGYTETGALQQHDRRHKASAAGSMDTSLGDWANFLAVVARGEGLSKQAKYEMIRRTIVIDSAKQFPTLSDERTDRWQAIGLGYAVGWGVFETPYGLAFFKEGHDDGTANYAVCIAERRDCILLMSNSVRAEAVFVSLVHKLLGDLPIPAEWEGYGPG
jgi:CubicO group peptidase (beta-lactamase class C family)